MKLAVVMPVLNHVYYTQKAVESLLKNTDTQDFQLIMIDDGCTDDTWAYAQELGERLGGRFRYHQNSENIGVNPSWNAGVRMALAGNAEYIAIVNNDLLFAPHWDTPLIQALELPQMGVVSPVHTYGAVPSGWPDGGQQWQRNPGQLDILGCCFMCKASLFDQIGLFPEELKIYFGDNWIVLASQKKGLRAGHISESHIHHFFSITTSKLDNDPIWAKESPIWREISSKL